MTTTKANRGRVIAECKPGCPYWRKPTSYYNPAIPHTHEEIDGVRAALMPGEKFHAKAPVKLFKWLNDNGQAPFQHTQWSLPTSTGPGEWMEPDTTHASGDLATCSYGLHVVDAKNIRRWRSARLFLVEVDGPVLQAEKNQKWVANRARLVEEVQFGALRNVPEDLVYLALRKEARLPKRWEGIRQHATLAAFRKAEAKVIQANNNKRRELAAERYEVLAKIERTMMQAPSKARAAELSELNDKAWQLASEKRQYPVKTTETFQASQLACLRDRRSVIDNYPNHKTYEAVINELLGPPPKTNLKKFGLTEQMLKGY